jgi:hypothetical protein
MMWMWATCAGTVFVGWWWLFRRFRPPRYSVQKWARTSRLLRRVEVIPLCVPWSVQLDSYTPATCNLDGLYFWWFRLSRMDGRLRFLVEVCPYPFSRLPHNPHGRTGTSGRGVLGRYGANNCPVTVDWSPILGFVRVHDCHLVSKEKRVFYGFCDHPLNTDNAWVEADIRVRIVDDCDGTRYPCPPWLHDILRENSPFSRS